MQTLKINLVIAAVAGSLAVCQVANGALTIVPSIGGAATGASKVNFDSLPAVGGTLGPSGNEVMVGFTPDAAVVTGSSVNVYAAPYLSGGNGTGFGSPNQPNGLDATKYLTTGSTGAYAGSAVTLTFTTSQMYLGLLWGSVDLYNTLTFYNGNSVVGALTGFDVTPSATGDQGSLGTFYVNINSSFAFNRVVATSSQYAFEFDNIAYNDVAYTPTPVPEPTTMIAAALLLLPFGASTVRILRSRKGV